MDYPDQVYGVAMSDGEYGPQVLRLAADAAGLAAAGAAHGADVAVFTLVGMRRLNLEPTLLHPDGGQIESRRKGRPLGSKNKPKGEVAAR